MSATPHSSIRQQGFSALNLLFVSVVCCIVTFCVGFVSCGGSEDSHYDSSALIDSSGIRFDSAAEAIYTLYVRGQYNEFVDHMASCKDKPQSYREQMAVLLKMRHQAQERQHEGVEGCRCIRRDERREHFCNAYIELRFKDGSSEQILVPFVEVGGKWLVK